MAEVGPCEVRVPGISEKSTPKGFEPSRAEPNGFLVHLLNHSDTVSVLMPRNIGVYRAGHFLNFPGLFCSIVLLVFNPNGSGEVLYSVSRASTELG